MPVVSIATRETVPVDNHRVVAMWYRRDNSGINIANADGEWISWLVDTKRDAIPDSRVYHASEKEALDRLVSLADV